MSQVEFNFVAEVYNENLAALEAPRQNYCLDCLELKKKLLGKLLVNTRDSIDPNNSRPGIPEEK